MRADRNDRAVAAEHQRIEIRIACTRAPVFTAAVMARGGTDKIEVIGSLASLIAQHGARDEERNAPLAIDPATKDAWIDLLRRWVSVIVGAPKIENNLLRYLATAIGRFGFKESLPDLKRLIGVAFSSEQQNLLLRVAMFGNEYQRALMRVGGNAAAAVAIEYLEHKTFGLSAALVLKSISDKDLGMPEPGLNERWPWYDGVEAARAARATPRPAPRNALAEPIFAAIDRLARPGADRNEQVLAIGLSRIALGMPHGDVDALIERVMALPEPLATKQTLLAAMVMDGHVVDFALIMGAIDAWIEDARDPKHDWHKRQHTWEIEPWLELLPFSTRPESVLEGLAKVKAFYGKPWAKTWERVLGAVAAVPGEQGEQLLASLARVHKDIAHEYSWTRAILDRGSPAAIFLYIDLFAEGVFGDERAGVDAWDIGQQLAAHAQTNPDLKEELRRRYRASQAGRVRQMLEIFLSETANAGDVLAMVEKYAADGREFDSSIHRVIRTVALEHVPIGEGSNAYNVYPSPVAELRKALFDLAEGPAQLASIAKGCLEALDELRDEYGIAAGDPRHPDVMSGRPWPAEVGASRVLRA